MSLLPSRLEVSPSFEDAEILDVDGEEAAEAFDALGSETARRVLSVLYEEPRPPPEIREIVGTSLQNVHYHLDRLEQANLIEPAGTGYSEKGNEMTVYAPARKAVVLFAGSGSDRSHLERLLKRLFGLFLTLAVSTVVFALFTSWLRRRAAEPAYLEEDVAVEFEAATAPTYTIDPVVAFFLGGCVVLAAIAIWWVLRPRLRSRLPVPSR